MINLKQVDEIRYLCTNIISLYHSGSKSKAEYARLLKSIPVIPKKEEETPLTCSLQNYMDDLESIASSYTDNAVTRMAFGLQCLKTNLWNRIKDSGIGCLLDFKFDGSFYAKIGLSLELPRKSYETDEQYMERNRQFLDGLSLEYKKSKHTNRLKVLDNDRNRTWLHEWLAAMFGDTFHCKMNTQGSEIWTLEVRTRELLIPVALEEKEEKHNNDADIENIFKKAKEIILNVNTACQFSQMFDATISCISGQFYDMCILADANNRFVSEYEKNLRHRDKNKMTQKKIQSIASLVAVEEIMETGSIVIAKIEEKMEMDYSMYAWCSANEHGFHIRLSVSSTGFPARDSMFNNVFVDKDTRIPVKHIYDVVDFLKTHEGIEIRDVTTKVEDDGIFISGMEGNMDIRHAMKLLDTNGKT